jgi:hypothetical protein
MSDAILSRKTRNLDITIGTAVASSSTLMMADMAGGTLLVSGVTSTHSIAVYGSHNGTAFSALYGHDGQAATVSVPAEGGASAMPDAIYPTRYIRLVSSTDLGTAATAIVSLKS